MKKECLRSAKLLSLCGALDCSRPEAIGYLTLLWDFVEDNAPAGNVGRWPDAAIARACDWTGNPDRFVGALIDTRWLDRHGEHRLIVHDWAQHCQNWVKAKLGKMGLPFVTAEGTAEATAEGTAEGNMSPTVSPSLYPTSHLANPSLANPHTKPVASAVANPVCVSNLSEQESGIVERWYARRGQPALSPTRNGDAAVAAMVHETWGDGALSEVDRVAAEVAKKWPECATLAGARLYFEAAAKSERKAKAAAGRREQEAADRKAEDERRRKVVASEQALFEQYLPAWEALGTDETAAIRKAIGWKPGGNKLARQAQERACVLELARRREEERGATMEAETADQAASP